MTLSVIIPAYNEEDVILRCLEALARQRSHIDEIIVVDNNSTDKTVALVQKAYPDVKIVAEKVQGTLAARNTGVAAAGGDIIARLDADTIVSDDWAAALHKAFKSKQYDALSGPVVFYDMPFRGLVRYFSNSYVRFMNRLAGSGQLYGNNMAMTKNAWQRVLKHSCFLPGVIHEDLDLAIHVARLGLRIGFVDEVWAYNSIRRYNSSFIGYVRYAWLWPRTYACHGAYAQAAVAWLATVLAVVAQPPVRLILYFYDPQREKFSITATHRVQGRDIIP